MKNFNIFKKEYSCLFTTHGYSVDTIGCILHAIGYNLINYNSQEAKLDTLNAIRQLLVYDIICVRHWGKYHDIINTLNLNIEQTITFIDLLWHDNLEHIEFEGMPTFEYSSWYFKKHQEYGISVETDWDEFSEEFIPKIQHWSEERMRLELAKMTEKSS